MGIGENNFNLVLEQLPLGWEEKAKELGALRRAREIKTPEELLRLILLYLTEGKSMSMTSAIINLSGELTMSKVAVFKRIQNSGEWLHWMCKHIYSRAGLLIEKPDWLKGRDVLLVDGSKDVKTGKEQRSYMLHYSLELFTLAIREFLITEEKTGEKLSNFKRFEKKDIIIADRMYGTLKGISYLRKLGADYILRLRAEAFNVYDEKGRKIDIAKRLSRLPVMGHEEITGWCALNGEKIPVRICAVRKDKRNEQLGMERLKRTKGCKRGLNLVSALQAEYNKYVIVVTSLGKEVSAEQVLQLYRTRWQIEIAFKRLKSIFEYNQMPARKPENIKTWFYGKMLLAVLCETLVNTGRFSPQRK